MTPNPIFHTAEPLMAARRAMAERAILRHPGAFRDPTDALSFLANITLPASGVWAFAGNAKSGTTSTKRFLFHLEFGAPLSVSFNSPIDINPDAISHHLVHSGVFRTLPNLVGGLGMLARSLRLATARHPVARAISSFNYICLTDAQSSPWLLTERLRMNATTGFDWSKDRFNHDGFLKFLTHLALNEARPEGGIDDPHLRPQVRNVRPEVFQPDLLGRTEDLPAFFAAIAESLNRPLPKHLDFSASNRQNSVAKAQALVTKDSKRLMAQVFAADFTWLNEDVDSWRP